VTDAWIQARVFLRWRCLTTTDWVDRDEEDFCSARIAISIIFLIFSRFDGRGKEFARQFGEGRLSRTASRGAMRRQRLPRIERWPFRSKENHYRDNESRKDSGREITRDISPPDTCHSLTLVARCWNFDERAISARWTPGRRAVFVSTIVRGCRFPWSGKCESTPWCRIWTAARSTTGLIRYFAKCSSARCKINTSRSRAVYIHQLRQESELFNGREREREREEKKKLERRTARKSPSCRALLRSRLPLCSARIHVNAHNEHPRGAPINILR